MAGSADSNILRVSVVLYPSLVNLIDQPPATGGSTLQHEFNIPISKAVGKEGRKSCAGPAVDTKDEGELDSIALGYKDQVVLGSQCHQEWDQISLPEAVFPSVFVHYQAFAAQDLAHPLISVSY